MCGRYTLTTPPAILAEMFGVTHVPPIEPHYNIAPTQQVLAVREDPRSDERTADLMKWGLIPSWAKDAKIGNQLINARSETVLEKPAFKAAFEERRCLVIADGFFEWKKLARGKQPYLIRRPDGSPFAFAGLWEYWKREGHPVVSCTIITTDANQTMTPLHDRMPVILDPADYDSWLSRENRDVDALQSLLVPEADGKLITFPVSNQVNKPANDDPSLIEEVDEEADEAPEGPQGSLFPH